MLKANVFACFFGPLGHSSMAAVIVVFCQTHQGCLAVSYLISVRGPRGVHGPSLVQSQSRVQFRVPVPKSSQESKQRPLWAPVGLLFCGWYVG